MRLLNIFQIKNSESGLASIEFAFIAPVLAFALVGLVDVGLYINARADMTSSVKSGVDYYLTGGQDSNTAVSIVAKAWTKRPEYSVIKTERFCSCTNIVLACTNSCSDGSQPEAFKKIIVGAYYDGLLLQTQYYSDETVRVR